MVAASASGRGHHRLARDPRSDAQRPTREPLRSCAGPEGCTTSMTGAFALGARSSMRRVAPTDDARPITRGSA